MPIKRDQVTGTTPVEVKNTVPISADGGLDVNLTDITIDDATPVRMQLIGTGAISGSVSISNTTLNPIPIEYAATPTVNLGTVPGLTIASLPNVTLNDPVDMGAGTILREYLDTNGDGTGTTNANGDYSSSADVFYIEAPTGLEYLVKELVWQVRDGAGTPSFSTYGILSALTNGITCKVMDGGTELADIFGGVAVVDNAGLELHADEIRTEGGSLVVARFRFDPPIYLEVGHTLEIGLNDDFTDLVGHYFKAVGYSKTA